MRQHCSKALVIGGGIGGLSAAIALRQAQCEVDLVEAKSEWGRSGVGIIQPSNALRALHALGLAQPCLDAGFAYDHYEYTDAQGKLLSVTPGLKALPQFPAFNGILRGILHDILLNAALSAMATIHLGTRVASLTQDEDHVQVMLTDGSVGQYDIVIAADGIHSATRQQLFGVGHEARLTGQSVWRLTMPRPQEMTQGVMMVGDKRKAGYIPVSHEEMYLLLVTQEVNNARFAREELAPALLDRLQEFAGLVHDTRRYITEQADIVYRPMEVVMLPRPWHQGRVILIGDAAHASTPHLGQGAAMAIEDAVVLAELVARGVPPQKLGQAYMERRYDRACLIQNSSMAIGDYELGRRPDLDLFATLASARSCAVQPI